MDDLNLSSVTGVVAAAFFVTEVLKRIFVNNVWFGKLPVWCYTFATTIILVFVANQIKINGQVMLAGNWYQLVWRALINASAASGFYTWLRGTGTIADAQPMGKPSVPPKLSMLLISCILLFGLSGCGASTTPIQSAYTHETLYNDTLQTLITLRQNGQISDSEYKIIEPLRATAYSAVSTEEYYAISGDTASLSAYAPTINAAIDALITEIIKVKRVGGK